MALKQEDFEKFAEYLDLQDVETFEDAKTKFDDVYARKEAYQQQLMKDPAFTNTMLGKRLGKYENDLKSFAKELGVEFDKEAFKGGQDYEAVAKIVMDGIKQKHTDTVKDLESKIGADPSELVKEWETKLENEKKLSKKWKTELEDYGKRVEAEKAEWAANQRKEKLNKSIDTIFSGVSYADEALKDELKIAGFKTKILSDVQFDLDENENFVLLGKDKLPITNPAKAGATYSPEDYVKEQAIKFGIYKLNDNGGQRANPVVFQKTQDTDPNLKTIPVRQVHPSALAAQG